MLDSMTTAVRANAIRDRLRRADALISSAIQMIGESDGVVDGLPVDMLVSLDGRSTSWEARTLVDAANQLRSLPHLSGAFSGGIVSWSQVRAILGALKLCPAGARPAIDALIGSHAPALIDADPDRLVAFVEDRVAEQRADLMLRREDRAVSHSFLHIQGRLDGGSRIYGEADPESTATIIDALDAYAGAPEHPDRRGTSRARQRFHALIDLCEASLAGAAGAMRPRPRVIAVADVAALGTDRAMRVLQGLTGRPARLTRVAADAIVCDATIVPVLTDRGRPIAVGDAATPVTATMRAALIARDGGCRFPGCHAPAAWTDAHHVVPGRGRSIDDLALLCRRCHRRVHRYGWRISINRDGTMTFALRGRSHTSIPRHRDPPALE